MKLKHSLGRLLSAAAVISSCSPFAARAAISQLDVSYYTGSAYTFSYFVQGGQSQTSLAVAFSADRTGGQSLPAGHPDPFTTFCLDVDTTLASGWWKSGTFSDTTLTSDSGKVRQGVDSLRYAAQLYLNYAGTIPAGGWNTAQKAEGSALQLAIWEVLYEYRSVPNAGFDISSGSGFRVANGDANILDRAQDMLDSLTFGSPDMSLNTTFWNAVTDSNGGHVRSSQDLIGPITATGVVPEPGTWIAGALLLLPFSVGTLRILRRRQA